MLGCISITETSMDFLFGLGVGWGIGIVFGINLSKLLWYSDSESVWDRHASILEKANHLQTKAQREVEPD